MNTSDQTSFHGTEGVLLRSDRVPSVNLIQEAIDRYQFPCLLDDYGLSNKRMLLSGSVLGFPAYAPFRTRPSHERRNRILEREFEDGYDTSIEINVIGTLSNRVLAGCSLLGIADMSGGLIWYSDRPGPMKERVLSGIETDLSRLNVLKAVLPSNTAGTVSSDNPELEPWETASMRKQAVSTLMELGLVEPVQDEVGLSSPPSFCATTLGHQVALMHC